MKKATRLMALIAAMLCLPVASKAQNIQVLYDTNRECITTTLEKFTPDAWGSTFFFVDMDYSPKAVGAYTEIAREFCFWQDSEWNWLSVHAEFNGGLAGAYSFNNAWLLGLTYSGHSEDFSKTWSVTASYTAMPGPIVLDGLLPKKQPHGYQLTGVWGINFANNWMSYSGFIDFWREFRSWQNTSHILLSEHQLWVNLNKMLKNLWKLPPNLAQPQRKNLSIWHLELTNLVSIYRYLPNI